MAASCKHSGIRLETEFDDGYSWSTLVSPVYKDMQAAVPVALLIARLARQQYYSINLNKALF